METKIDEEYVSMRLAHADIENAIRLLNHARTEKNPDVQRTIVQYCIIEYARPFKSSYGVFRTKFRPLDEDLIFPTKNSDHKELIIERDKRIAHGDLKEYNPRLYYWPEQDIFPIVQRPSHLYDHIDTLIDKMLLLCDIVLRYVVDRMKNLEIEIKNSGA